MFKLIPPSILFHNKSFKFLASSLLLMIICLSHQKLAYSQDTVLTGKLEVLISDSKDGTKSRLDYKLLHLNKQKKIKRTDLKFLNKAPENLISGLKIKVKGKSIGAGGRLVVGGSKDSFTVIEEELTANASLGDSSAVVLRIKSDTAVTNRTHEQLAAEVQQVALRLQEVSYGLASLSNDKNNDGIADVITVELATSTAGAAESTAFTLCSNAKTKAGVSGYRHYICILPPDMNYSWYGTAYIGGTDLVINGNYSSGYPNGLLHELGHNWGSHHANTPSTEYGDSTCIMGGNASTANRHFNAAHKINMGWLSATSASAGIYQVSAVENSTGLRVLKIRDNIANKDLYVSTRARIGNYSSGPIQPGLTHIHTWPGGASQTVLLAALGNGQSYSQNGITFTQLSHDGSTATVQIGANCQTAAPSITLSPTIQYKNDLSATSYTVTVKNNNVNCPDAVPFSVVSQSNNALLSTAVSSQIITLTSGQSGSLTLTASPSSELTQGSYDINVSLSADNQAGAISTVKYILDQTAPSQVFGLSATVSKRKISLQWQASSDSGGSGLSEYQVLRNGIVIANTTNLSYQDAAPNGTHSYSIKAKDKAGNLGLASTSVQATIGNGGGGTGGGPGGGKK